MRLSPGGREAVGVPLRETPRPSPGRVLQSAGRGCATSRSRLEFRCAKLRARRRGGFFNPRGGAARPHGRGWSSAARNSAPVAGAGSSIRGAGLRDLTVAVGVPLRETPRPSPGRVLQSAGRGCATSRSRLEFRCAKLRARRRGGFFNPRGGAARPHGRGWSSAARNSAPVAGTGSSIRGAGLRDLTVAVGVPLRETPRSPLWRGSARAQKHFGIRLAQHARSFAQRNCNRSREAAARVLQLTQIAHNAPRLSVRALGSNRN